MFSLIFLLVPAWLLEELADTFPDDGMFLLQMSKRQTSADANIPHAMLGSQVIISPSSAALKLVGRHDIVRHGGEEAVRFDAAGFEVQFRVQGAREIKVNISQQITGPGGWYAMENPSPENVYEDGCFESKKKTLALLEGIRDLAWACYPSATSLLGLRGWRGAVRAVDEEQVSCLHFRYNGGSS